MKPNNNRNTENNLVTQQTRPRLLPHKKHGVTLLTSADHPYLFLQILLSSSSHVVDGVHQWNPNEGHEQYNSGAEGLACKKSH